MKEQVIYFIQNVDTEEIKIGVTENFKSRLASIKTSSPSDINVLLLCRGGYDAEKKLHHKFQQYHKKGEWFYPSVAILQFIREKKEEAYLERRGADDVHVWPKGKDDPNSTMRSFPNNDMKVFEKRFMSGDCELKTMVGTTGYYGKTRDASTFFDVVANDLGFDCYVKTPKHNGVEIVVHGGDHMEALIDVLEFAVKTLKRERGDRP